MASINWCGVKGTFMDDKKKLKHSHTNEEVSDLMISVCVILTITLGGTSTHLLVHAKGVLGVWVHSTRMESRV